MSDSISENLCALKYPYRAEAVLVEDEEYTISMDITYSVALKEKPSSLYPVTVFGYIEVDYMPSAEYTFYVDYETSLIYFCSADKGRGVLVTYYKTGSPIIAQDVNRFSLFLVGLHSVLFSFVVEALTGSRVRIYGGKFVNSVPGDTISTQKELFIDFGVNGNFPLSAMTTGYFKKVLVGVDVAAAQMGIIESAEAPRYNAIILPSYPLTFKPVAIITVAESNGAIADITQSDIISVLNCFSS